jgi:hypothetical protein
MRRLRNLKGRGASNTHNVLFHVLQTFHQQIELIVRPTA